MHQILFRMGLRYRPHRGANSAPQTFQLDLRNLLLRGRRRKRKKKENRRSRSKTTPPQFERPDRGDHLRISSSNLAGEELSHWATFQLNCIILTSAILSQYTRVTDDRQHIVSIAELAMHLQRSLKAFVALFSMHAVILCKLITMIHFYLIWFLFCDIIGQLSVSFSSLVVPLTSRFSNLCTVRMC